MDKLCDGSDGKAPALHASGFERANRDWVEHVVRVFRTLDDELRRSTDLKSTLAAILTAAMSCSGADSGAVYLRDPRSRALQLVVHNGLSEPFVHLCGHYGPDSPQATLVDRGQPTYSSISDLDAPPEAAAEGLLSVAVIPAVERGEAVGCIILSSRSFSEFPLPVRHTVESLAPRVACAVSRTRAEEELHQAQQFSQQLIEAANLIVLGLNARGVVTRLNPAAEVLTGYRADELIGSDWFDIVVPREKYPDAWATFQQVVSGGKSLRTIVNPIITKWGDERYIDWRNTLQFEGGQLVQCLSIGVDITEQQQAEQRLRESEERYRALVDLSPDPVMVISQGHILFANRAAAELCGVSDVSHLIGQTSLSFVHPDSHASVIERMRQVEEKLVTVPLVEQKVLRPDGTTVYVEAAGAALRYEGTPAMLLILRDITARKEAEAALQRANDELERRVAERTAELDAVLPAIANPFIIYGPAGDIVRMNAAAEKTIGFTSDTRNRPLLERIAALHLRTLDGDPLDLEGSVVVRALRGEFPPPQMRLITYAGQSHCFTVTAAPIITPDNQLRGAVATFADVTALYEMQEQREEMLRSISHDLRIPLCGVQGHAQYLEILAERHDAPWRDRDCIEAIIVSARRMNNMIQDLVDSARIEAGQMDLCRKPTTVVPFFESTLRRVSSYLATDRVRLIAHAPDTVVLADPGRLERVFLSLLANALAYSAPDTEVRVTVEERHGQAVISIEYEGPGIPPEDFPRVFDRYYRGRKSHNDRGPGLGLYATRLLVQAQGGEIWVKSEPGRGTRFTFCLPPASLGKTQPPSLAEG